MSWLIIIKQIYLRQTYCKRNLWSVPTSFPASLVPTDFQAQPVTKEFQLIVCPFSRRFYLSGIQLRRPIGRIQVLMMIYYCAANQCHLKIVPKTSVSHRKSSNSRILCTRETTLNRFNLIVRFIANKIYRWHK